MAGVNFNIGADSRKASKELDTFAKKTRKVAKSIAKGFTERVGHKMFDGLSRAAAAIPGLLMEAVDAASDLNEELSKSEAVFGRSSEQISKWADNAAQAMGMSKVAALETTGSLGGLFLNMGKTSDEAAAMSMEMAQLAADMGSFNNASTEDAVLALGSALRGEAEPIRKFNVQLSDSVLKAKAFAMGIFEGKGSLEPATKAMAAYEVILEQTAIQQGDFARTSDGLANSKKILTSQLKDAAGTIGESLLPAMLDLTHAMREIDWEAKAQSVAGFTEVLGDLGKTAKSTLDVLYDNSGAEGFTDGIAKMISMVTHSTEVTDQQTKAWKEQTAALKENIQEYEKQLKIGEEKSGLSDQEKKNFEEEQKRLAEEDKAKSFGRDMDIEKARAMGDTDRLQILEREKKIEEDIEAIVAKYKSDGVTITKQEAEKLRFLKEQAAWNEKNRQKKEKTKDEPKKEVEDSYEKRLKDLQRGLIEDQFNRDLGKKSANNQSLDLANEKIGAVQDNLFSLSGRSQNSAVSSMQSIGGGGGVATMGLDIQKQQATLLARLVELTEQKENLEKISDY